MQKDILAKRISGWVYEADHDVVGLWELCRAARDDWGATTPAQVRKIVLQLVRRLLDNGVEAVDIVTQHPWPDQHPEGVIARISREWDALGREPNVPDIVWFKRN